MSVPNNLKYTKDHEWVQQDGDVATVGITDHAQQALGDVVFVDLPAVGTKVTQGATFGTVESVKAVSDIFSPISGVITAVNESLAKQPDLVNSDPYKAAWMVKVKLSAPAELDKLMSPADYAKIA